MGIVKNIITVITALSFIYTTNITILSASDVRRSALRSISCIHSDAARCEIGDRLGKKKKEAEQAERSLRLKQTAILTTRLSNDARFFVSIDEAFNQRIYMDWSTSSPTLYLEGILQEGRFPLKHPAEHLKELSNQVGRNKNWLGIPFGNLYFNDHTIIFRSGVVFTSSKEFDEDGLPRYKDKRFKMYYEKVKSYSCFIVWKDGRKTIERLKIKVEVKDETNPWKVRKPVKICRVDDPQEEDIKDKIELAIYGQQVVKNGRVKKQDEIAHEFADPGHAKERYPHSMLGIAENGDVIYCVAAGNRKENPGVGFTVEETGQLLKDKDVYNGIMLAQGGDTNIFYNGEQVTFAQPRNRHSAVLAIAFNRPLDIDKIITDGWSDYLQRKFSANERVRIETIKMLAEADFLLAWKLLLNLASKEKSKNVQAAINNALINLVYREFEEVKPRKGTDGKTEVLNSKKLNKIKSLFEKGPDGAYHAKFVGGTYSTLTGSFSRDARRYLEGITDGIISVLPENIAYKILPHTYHISIAVLQEAALGLDETTKLTDQERERLIFLIERIGKRHGPITLKLKGIRMSDDGGVIAVWDDGGIIEVIRQEYFEKGLKITKKIKNARPKKFLYTTLIRILEDITPENLRVLKKKARELKDLSSSGITVTIDSLRVIYETRWMAEEYEDYKIIPLKGIGQNTKPSSAGALLPKTWDAGAELAAHNKRLEERNIRLYDKRYTPSNVVEGRISKRRAKLENSSKHYVNGKAAPFRGLTCIIRVKQGTDLFNKLLNLQKDLQRDIQKALESAGEKIDKNRPIFSFLEPSSFHMTICDLDPGVKYNPEERTSVEKTQEQFNKRLAQVKEAFKAIGVPGEISTHVKGIGLKRTITALVRFSDSGELKKIKDMETIIKNETGISVREFVGHISLAYLVNYPGGEKSPNHDAFQKVIEALGKYEDIDLGNFSFDSLEFTYYPDMNHFIPILTKNLVSGKTISSNEDYDKIISTMKSSSAGQRKEENYNASVRTRPGERTPTQDEVRRALKELNDALSDSHIRPQDAFPWRLPLEAQRYEIYIDLAVETLNIIGEHNAARFLQKLVSQKHVGVVPKWMLRSGSRYKCPYLRDVFGRAYGLVCFIENQPYILMAPDIWEENAFSLISLTYEGYLRFERYLSIEEAHRRTSLIEPKIKDSLEIIPLRINMLINREKELRERVIFEMVSNGRRNFVLDRWDEEHPYQTGNEGWHETLARRKYGPLYNEGERQEEAKRILEKALARKDEDADENLAELIEIIPEIERLKALGSWDIDERSDEISTAFSKIKSLDSISNNRKKYGNKAVNLHRLIELGLSVPPGFVISTEALKDKKVPPIEILRSAIQELEKKTGKKFRGRKNPLHLSVRSSPEYSMPGLLTTELHITTEEQLIEAIQTVRDSWGSEVAQKYRDLHNIPDDLGTAVIVQAMVFGNFNENSASGVMFTQDPIDGSDEITGCYAVKAVGKTVVSRSDTEVRKIKEDTFFKDGFSHIYSQFARIKDILEREFKNVQEVEFVIENGKLWILQIRDAALSPRAEVQAALSFARKKIINKFEMLKMLENASKKKIYKFEVTDEYNGDSAIAKGKIPSSPGVAVGPVIFSLNKARKFTRLGKPAIFIALKGTEDIQQAILGGEVAGIITQYGHEALHEAVLARAHGIPIIDGELSGYIWRLFNKEEDVERGWEYKKAGRDRIKCRYVTKPEIERNALVIGARRITEGTEIVMDANRGYVWLKKTEPSLVEDRVVQLKGLDFDYEGEEVKARVQFEPYDYEALVLMHADMISDIIYTLKTLQEITRESLRLNLAAHVVHQLVVEKGKVLGKPLQDITSDLLKASKHGNHSGELYVAQNQDIAKKLGIEEILISDTGFGVYFLPFTGYIVSRSKEEEKAAIEAHRHFVENIRASGLIEPSKIQVIGFEECDPMPHGHGSMFSYYKLGVRIELDSTSKLESIKFLNTILSTLKSSSAGTLNLEDIESLNVKALDTAIASAEGVLYDVYVQSKVAAEVSKLGELGTIVINDDSIPPSQREVVSALYKQDSSALKELERLTGCVIRLRSQLKPDDIKGELIIISDTKLSGYDNARYLMINDIPKRTDGYLPIAPLVGIAKALLGIKDKTQINSSLKELYRSLCKKPLTDEVIQQYIQKGIFSLELPKPEAYDYRQLEQLQRQALAALIAA